MSQAVTSPAVGEIGLAILDNPKRLPEANIFLAGLAGIAEAR